MSSFQFYSIFKLCDKIQEIEKFDIRFCLNCDEDSNEDVIDEVILPGNNTCELVLFPEIQKHIYLNINNHLPLISVQIDSPPPNL
jgi:hypothetical protein